MQRTLAGSIYIWRQALGERGRILRITGVAGYGKGGYVLPGNDGKTAVG